MTTSPIEAHGPIKGNSARIKKLHPDNVLVLSGRSRTKILSSDHKDYDIGVLFSDSVFAYILSGYSYFYVVKKSVIKDERRETMQSRDHRMHFELIIRISARVTDPIKFLQEHGVDGSIIEPCWSIIKEKIRFIVARFFPNELHDLYRELSELSRRITSDRPYSGCVQVTGMDVDIAIDPNSMTMLKGLETQHLVREYGRDIFLAMALSSPDRADDYRRAYEQFKEHDRDAEERFFARFEKIIDTFRNLAGDDHRAWDSFIKQSPVREALVSALVEQEKKRPSMSSSVKNLLPKEELRQLPPPKKVISD